MYLQDHVNPKVWTDYVGMNHQDEGTYGRNFLFPYYFAMLRCFLTTSDEACPWIFSDMKGSLCNNPELDMRSCKREADILPPQEQMQVS